MKSKHVVNYELAHFIPQSPSLTHHLLDAAIHASTKARVWFLQYKVLF